MEGIHWDNLFERKFDMDEGNHRRITIWKTYHNESLIKEFNLEENERIFLFNSKNVGYDGKNINHLNQFLCEGVTLVYPYLNNLKSDIIGFQHYRRWFHSDEKSLNVKRIMNGEIQCFASWNDYYLTLKDRVKEHCNYWSVYECGMGDDIMEFLEKEYPEIYNHHTMKSEMIGFSISAMSWESYLKYGKFIWDYICFINDKYDLRFEEERWARHMEEKFIKFNQRHRIPRAFGHWDYKKGYGHDNWYTEPYESKNSFRYGLYRMYSYHIEFLSSVWFNTHSHFIDKDNSIFYLVDENKTRN